MNQSGWGTLLAFELVLQAVGAAGQQEPSQYKPSVIDSLTPQGPILLSRTPVAPFGASGSAYFLSGLGSGNPPMLSLELRGFGPGHYQLGIVRESDQEFVPLAKFSITDPTAGPDRDTSQNTKTTTSGHQSQQLVSRNVLPLARLTDPRDFAKLVVADPAGNFLLVADLRPPKATAGGS